VLTGDNRARGDSQPRVSACELGAIVGLFFGLIFGGIKGRWLDVFYPPEQTERIRYV
jgi:hypothetical protein